MKTQPKEAEKKKAKGPRRGMPVEEDQPVSGTSDYALKGTLEDANLKMQI